MPIIQYFKTENVWIRIKNAAIQIQIRIRKKDSGPGENLYIININESAPVF